MSLSGVAQRAVARGFTATAYGMPWTPGRVRALVRAPSLPDAVAGRRVVITGASSGIGRATALALAAAGAEVVLVARTGPALEELARAIEAAGGRAVAMPCDLSDADAARALGEDILDRAGDVDVLVNNAGRSIRRPVLASVDRPHDFERTMALNYFGALALTLALLPAMEARRDGHIINISTTGTQTATPRFAAYLASKAALDACTRSMGVELCNRGIRVTTVHMPLVRTPMIAPSGAYEGAPALTPEAAAGMIAEAVRTRPRRVSTRIGLVMEAADLVAPGALEQAFNQLYRASRASASGARGARSRLPI